MNIDFFTEANKLWRKGFQDDALENLDKFINSFECDTQKELWVKEYLPQLKVPKDGIIKSEFIIALFRKLIAPVLINGVRNRDTELMLWSLKLETSLLFETDGDLYFKMKINGFQEILIGLYEIAPDNNEIESLYFSTRIGQIRHNVFNNSRIYDDWNPDYARGVTVEECQQDLDEIKTLRKIDRDNEYVEFLNEYESNLNKLMEKLC